MNITFKNYFSSNQIEKKNNNLNLMKRIHPQANIIKNKRKKSRAIIYINGRHFI